MGRPPRRNKNRGYQQLRVWQDAIQLYKHTRNAVKNWGFIDGKTAGQAIASADSVHRNISEGYCRRSINEYLQFLNYALASLGESVSGYVAYQNADQLSEQQFEQLDSLSYRLENGLLRLIESLEHKRNQGDWIDTLLPDDPDKPTE